MGQRMGADHVDASVVILTRNAGPGFREVLSAVFQQETRFQYEVLVIDSGSVDDTLLIASDFPARIIRIDPLDFNHGATRNFGARESVGESVVFLTQDALPKNANWLDALVQAMAADPHVAGCYSRQEPLPNAGLITIDKMNWSSFSGTERRVKSASPSEYSSMTPEQRLDLAAFDNVSSCVRKSVLNLLPFPRTEFAEDLMWGKLAIEHGYKLVFEPDSIVMHSHDRSIKHDYQRARLSAMVYRRMFGVHGVQTWREFLIELRGCFLHRAELLLGRRGFSPALPAEFGHMTFLSAAESFARWRGSVD